MASEGQTEDYGFLVERRGKTIVISDCMGGGRVFDAFDPSLTTLIASWMSATVQEYAEEIAENFGEEYEDDDE